MPVQAGETHVGPRRHLRRRYGFMLPPKTNSGPPPTPSFNILLQDGSALLQEDGDNLLTEAAP